MQQSSNGIDFRHTVELLVAQVPAGMVTTYGDIAALAGHPYAAKIVGGIAHYGPLDVPWHRVVNRFGGLASAFPGGPHVQQQLLESDGLTCTNNRVDNFPQHRWNGAKNSE